jgi:hypothetical protein
VARRGSSCYAPTVARGLLHVGRGGDHARLIVADRTSGSVPGAVGFVFSVDGDGEQNGVYLNTLMRSEHPCSSQERPLGFGKP